MKEIAGVRFMSRLGGILLSGLLGKIQGERSCGKSLWGAWRSGDILGVKRTWDITVRDRRESSYVRRILGIVCHEQEREKKILRMMSHIRVSSILGISSCV